VARAGRKGHCRNELTTTGEEAHQIVRGQRKRFSTAMELLRKPLVGARRRPTSGQDEGLTEDVDSCVPAERGRRPAAVIVAPTRMVNIDRADEVLAITRRGASVFGAPGNCWRLSAPKTMPTSWTSCRATRVTTTRPLGTEAPLSTAGQREGSSRRRGFPLRAIAEVMAVNSPANANDSSAGSWPRLSASAEGALMPGGRAEGWRTTSRQAPPQ